MRKHVNFTQLHTYKKLQRKFWNTFSTCSTKQINSNSVRAQSYIGVCDVTTRVSLSIYRHFVELSSWRISSAYIHISSVRVNNYTDPITTRSCSFARASSCASNLGVVHLSLYMVCRGVQSLALQAHPSANISRRRVSLDSNAVLLCEEKVGDFLNVWLCF